MLGRSKHEARLMGSTVNVPALQAATLAVREDNEAVDSPNDDAASTTVINLTSRDEDDSAEDSGDDSAASTEVINLAH